MEIIKYQGIDNVGYVTNGFKLLHFVAIDNNGERVSTDTFQSASLAKAWFDENYRGLF